MIFLYIYFGVFCALVGFRDAAGRNALIHKKKYYLRCITRSFLVGQLCFFSLLLLAFLLCVDLQIIQKISVRMNPVLGVYTAMVILSFIPYSIPNWEIKSLSTVLLLGPLTIVQPLVVIGSIVYGIVPFVNHELEVIFMVIGGCFCLLFEQILEHLGWSKRDACI